MPTKAPDRVVVLRPSLPEAARKTIVDIAERTSPREAPFEFTPDKERLLEQAQEDFRQDRTQTLDEFSSDMDAFMAELRSTPGKV
jgi:hypothetical protein